MQVTVIGAGLAGSECAWQLAQRGVQGTLREMKPDKRSPAHQSGDFAELVCSNSLRSDQLENAVGLLKEELRRLGSVIMACADETKVEAGGALAVDRNAFSAAVTNKIRSHPLITLEEGEYFVLGDNRNNSEDSRFANVGTVVEGEIIGRAWLRLNEFGFVGTMNLRREEGEEK